MLETFVAGGSNKMPMPDRPMLPIEKNVPISEYYLTVHKKLSARHGGGRHSKHNYPFEAMEVGDSFLVPKNIRVGDLRRLAVNYGEATGKSFLTIRDDAHQYRVWRTA